MKMSSPYGVGLVTHVQPSMNMLLSDLFKEIRFENFDFLLEIGAIYVDGVRIYKNIEVSNQNTVRIHRNPKRHPIENINWESLIIENNSDFVVINKPYGLPVHATVDNTIENVLFQLAKYLHEPLYITHRLDSETTGLMVYAKNKNFQNIFNYLIQNKLVEKHYEALTNKKPPLGFHRHYLKKDTFVPKLASKEPIEGWVEAELEILNQEDYLLENGESGFKNRIKLITGRTHQIRAQLTALNCPIFADTLYGDEENKGFPMGLKSSFLKFKWPEKNKEFCFLL